ncbi:nucleotidyltransferase [Mycoplasma sp. OR1901]|uniref:nucleotidyltransferase n=1 Tax=Mycoplasma sp. OR1901 TaxID=2742195 RepID=UPI001583F4F8|nr:nucleotidyltransferase [Mycoplasma sp. OR1901]QKT05298.1 nucleotidyltransferase [Mycoplasma sp. OR1901]
MQDTKKQRIIGVVVEYNPFHNGHAYQLEWIKNKFPDSKIYVAISHKYSQRGEIICTSFWKRKYIAKKYGVSKFIKLDVNISSQAAHIFAQKSIEKLYQKGINTLVFGSETSDVNIFIKIARTIKDNKEEYNKLIKKYLKQGGNSFPRAANLALNEIAGVDISMPNDILGLEYVKTIIDNNYDIEPFCHDRTVEFHSDNTKGKFASASKIRAMLKENQDVSEYTPMKLKGIKKRFLIENTYPKFKKIVSILKSEEIAQFKMISEGMENLFKKNIHHDNYFDFIESCVSKRYTRSRIKRAYLFVLLKIKK